MQTMRRHWRTLAISVPAVMIIVITLGLLGRRVAAEDSLLTARTLWQQQAVGAYQLSITQTSNNATCVQEILVDNERSGEGALNTCGQPANWTVTRLFNWIAQLDRGGADCYPGPAMCACRSALRLSVTYDPQLGYPRQVDYEWRKLPNFTNMDYYRSLFDQSFPGCDKDGTGGPVTMEISFSVVP